GRTRSSPTAPTAPTAPGPGPIRLATFPPLLRTDPQHPAPGGPPTLYSTCIFCNGALGTNEVLEDFPVGRRIAFDAARGRLWVVCRRCERWNLSPIEERWEAIEAAERIFRETR